MDDKPFYQRCCRSTELIEVIICTDKHATQQTILTTSAMKYTRRP